MESRLSPALFQVERQGLSPAISANRWLMGTFAAIAILGTGLPVLNPMINRELKLMGLLLGMTSSVAFTGMAAASARSTKIDGALDKAQIESLKRSLAAEAQFDYALAKINNDSRVLGVLSALPDAARNHYLHEFGLASLVAPPAPPAPVRELAGRAGEATLQELNLDEWRESNGLNGATIEQLYGHCIGKSLLFAGNPREGKTVAAHYALRQWVDANPSLVVFAFDKHFGMNNDPRFGSNWLGVPLVEGVPKNVQSCVVKAGSHSLETFLRRVEELLAYRVQAQVREPAVVVVIDEFTNLLEALSEGEVEQIVKIFSQVATEAPKFGINFWLILHSLTKEEIGIPRKVLRACHVVMGCEMTQDRIQVSNCPRTLDSDAIGYGQSVYREVGGLPAGFVTSLPVPNGYLPVPSLPNGLGDLVVEWKGVAPVVVPNSDPVDPPAKPTHNPEIQGRDIHASNAIRDFYKECKAWYFEQESKPTNQELRIKWHALTGKLFEPEQAIDKLREILERKS
jgi:hypothetical protein